MELKMKEVEETVNQFYSAEKINLDMLEQLELLRAKNTLEKAQRVSKVGSFILLFILFMSY
jgi:hypothetical protein